MHTNGLQGGGGGGGGGSGDLACQTVCMAHGTWHRASAPAWVAAVKTRQPFNTLDIDTILLGPGQRRTACMCQRIAKLVWSSQLLPRLGQMHCTDQHTGLQRKSWPAACHAAPLTLQYSCNTVAIPLTMENINSVMSILTNDIDQWQESTPPHHHSAVSSVTTNAPEPAGIHACIMIQSNHKDEDRWHQQQCIPSHPSWCSSCCRHTAPARSWHQSSSSERHPLPCTSQHR